MRILQVCGRVPFPPLDGGRIAMANIARGLRRCGAVVDVFALNTSRHRVDGNLLGGDLDFSLTTVEIDTRIRPLGAAVNLLRPAAPYHVARFFAQAAGRQLADLLRRHPYDVVQIETVQLATYLPVIRAVTSAPVVLRALNVEHEVWDRIARHHSGPAGWYLALQSARLRRYETAAIGTFDAILPITDRDATALAVCAPSIPLRVVPFGLFTDEYPQGAVPSSDTPTILFFGSLDWLPNREAALWLMSDIWPRIRTAFPEARLIVAGSAPPESLLRAAARFGAELRANVENARDQLAQAAVVVTPIRSGGGVRVKILEAMAMERCVVSTSVGAAGIRGENGGDLMIADDAEVFAGTVVRLLRSPAERRRIGQNGRRFVEVHHNAFRIGADLLKFYRELCGTRGASAAPR